MNPLYLVFNDGFGKSKRIPCEYVNIVERFAEGMVRSVRIQIGASCIIVAPSVLEEINGEPFDVEYHERIRKSCEDKGDPVPQFENENDDKFNAEAEIEDAMWRYEAGLDCDSTANTGY